MERLEKINNDFATLFREGQRLLQEGCGDVMNRHREEAFQRFEALGGIPYKTEDYLYADTLPVFDRDYRVVLKYIKQEVEVGEIFKCHVPNLDTNLILTINGWFVQENVVPERIGIIGICGWGGMAINAAAIDTRIKATAAMTMYDMTRVTANGYFDAEDSEPARYEKKKAMNAQRTVDYKNGAYALAGGVVDPLPEDAPQFVKDYYAYYKTPRGYHPRSLNSNGGWNATSSLSFLNMPILQYSSEIRSAVLLVHGEKAHSRYFSETVYSKLTGDNKELLIIPGANHTDLYDQMDIIPFEKLNAFFTEYLR